MNFNFLLRLLIAIIIIVGGIIIIIIGRPIPPEPSCIACGVNLAKIGGIAEMILGVAALLVQNKIANISKGQIG